MQWDGRQVEDSLRRPDDHSPKADSTMVTESREWGGRSLTQMEASRGDGGVFPAIVLGAS